jgi:diguanylate cyclase (GGDEF)-like protein
MRWYLARISPLRRTTRSKRIAVTGAVVSHLNITDRKLIEIEYARLAATDPLTGLPNRRFFDELCQLDFNRFLRFGGVSSLLMIDLDHFKSINDAHGHAAGDEVLRRISERGRSIFRSGDLLARWGGEEFVCLLPGTDAAGAIIIAETFRTAVQTMGIVLSGKEISVTTSIGVATFDKKDQTTECVLLRADKALYRAKHEGRNQVICGTVNRCS